MVGYYIAVAGFVIINVILVIIRSKSVEEDTTFGMTKSVQDLRAKQISGLREHAIKKKFEEQIDKTVKTTKRYDTESMLLRAGKSMSYAELVLIQIGVAVVTAVVILAGLKNPFMAVVLGLSGYFLPRQVFHSIANQRIAKMESQVGSFIQLVTERYKSHGDFSLAVKQSAPDFKGAEPMYSEIQKTILDIEVGTPVGESMQKMARRTGNKFLRQLADYYDISSTLGTKQARERIVNQAWVQFNEDYKMKQTLKSNIAGPRNEALIMVGFIPFMVVYQSVTSEDYISFMLTTQIGKVGSAFIMVVIILSLWFVNKKIGAPLD